MNWEMHRIFGLSTNNLMVFSNLLYKHYTFRRYTVPVVVRSILIVVTLHNSTISDMFANTAELYLNLQSHA